jgi:hypothetical protein
VSVYSFIIRTLFIDDHSCDDNLSRIAVHDRLYSSVGPTSIFAFTFVDESESGERAIRDTLLLIARDGYNRCDNLGRTVTAGARGRITASPINFL